MGTATAPPDLTLCNTEKSRSFTEGLYLHYLVQLLDYRLYITIIDTNRKSYMGNPMAPLDLILSDLEREQSR